MFDIHNNNLIENARFQPASIRPTSSSPPLKAKPIVCRFGRRVRRRQRRRVPRAETFRVPARRLQREGGVALRGELAGSAQVQAGNHRAGVPVSICDSYLNRRQNLKQFLSYLYFLLTSVALKYFRSTKCKSKSCDDATTNSCEPVFVQKKLLALKSTGDSLAFELFWLPVSCKCQASRES